MNTAAGSGRLTFARLPKRTGRDYAGFGTTGPKDQDLKSKVWQVFRLWTLDFRDKGYFDFAAAFLAFFFCSTLVRPGKIVAVPPAFSIFSLALALKR